MRKFTSAAFTICGDFVDILTNVSPSLLKYWRDAVESDTDVSPEDIEVALDYGDNWDGDYSTVDIYWRWTGSAGWSDTALPKLPQGVADELDWDEIIAWYF